jgi:hypothetical protein
VVIYHDETIFKTHEGQTWVGGGKPACHFTQNKGVFEEATQLFPNIEKKQETTAGKRG